MESFSLENLFMQMIINADVESTLKDKKSEQNSIHKLCDFYFEKRYRMIKHSRSMIDMIYQGAISDKIYSLHHYALILIYGLDIGQDINTGIKLLSKAINLKCYLAAYTMKIILLEDIIPRTVSISIYDLNIILKKNKHQCYYLSKVSSIINLNNIMDVDNNVDENKLSILTNKAIKSGSSYIHALIGTYYHFRKRHELAAKHYLEGIKLIERHCYLNLGLVYRDNYMMYRDNSMIYNPHQRERANNISDNEQNDNNIVLQLYFMALGLGNGKAASCLGGFYMDHGDIPRAKYFYKIGVNKFRDIASYHQLGIFYKTEYKYQKAITMFRISAKAGYPFSLENLKSLGIDP